jgi:hypothetical protein
MRERVFFSIYFSDGNTEKRRKKDVTLAFKKGDPLYSLCKKLRSTEIKRVIGIYSYKELTERAKKDNRSLNNFIKSVLKTQLIKNE